MPPVRARWLSFELVPERATGYNRTLGHHGNSVHVAGASLVHAMPMDAGGLVSKRVVDFNDDVVPTVDYNGRRGPQVIDGDDGPEKAIWREHSPANGPVVVDGFR